MRSRKRRRDSSDDDPSNSEDESGPRNYGKLVSHKKWVFGLCWWKGTGPNSGPNEIRYLDRRDAATLLPLIKRHVAKGTFLFSDEWKAYYRLGQSGDWVHVTVNHQENFVDPTTLCNTQAIEVAWERPKRKIVKHCPGVGAQLPKYLAEAWWRSKMMLAPGRHNPAIFEEFLRLVASNH